MAFPTATEIVTNPGELKGLFGLNPCLIADIPVDLVFSYSPMFSAEVTSRPVESGFDVTDARIIRPTFLTMECAFTDPDFSGSNIAKQALMGSLKQSLTMTWRDKRDWLDLAAADSKVISVSTPEAKYDNMLITDIRPQRDISTFNAYFFSIDFKRVNIVSSKITTIDPDQVPKEVQEKEALADKQNPTAAANRDKAKKIKQPTQDAGTVTGETPQEKTISKGIAMNLLFGGS